MSATTLAAAAPFYRFRASRDTTKEGPSMIEDRAATPSAPECRPFWRLTEAESGAL
jgi:hypothetical protein